MRRVIALRAEHGLHDVRFEKLETPLRVEGVGKDAQTCYERAIVPINLASGETGTYTAPVVPNSPIPALFGQKKLRENRALIDSIDSRLHMLGPGEYKIQAPAGSREYDMVDSPSGHMLLPVTEFDACATGGSASSALPLH